MKAIFLLLLSALFASPPLRAQLVNGMEDETRLYAESKQVNQFFRRFNGEEDEKGNRYNPDDKMYQMAKLRKRYFSVLFDESNQGISTTLKSEFVKQVIDKNAFLDFHGSQWFSEVSAIFTSNGKDLPITLYMELEKDHLGYKWIIRKVYADMYQPYFDRDTTKIGRFLHPLSHELDFMNLHKAFSKSDSISQFTAKLFVPDHLSVFLYEVEKGVLKFKSVREVKFHFFQVTGWYFELADFNRPGYNTGWLISNLVKLNTDADKNLLQRYLYHETN